MILALGILVAMGTAPSGRPPPQRHTTCLGIAAHLGTGLQRPANPPLVTAPLTSAEIWPVCPGTFLPHTDPAQLHLPEQIPHPVKVDSSLASGIFRDVHPSPRCILEYFHTPKERLALSEPSCPVMD